MTTFHSLLTDDGAAEFAAAQIAGTHVVFTELAIGDGNGAFVTPDKTRHGLVHEVYRAPVASVTNDPNNPSWFRIKAVIPASVGGFTIREMGFFSSTGKMIFHSNHQESEKPVLAEGAIGEMEVSMTVAIANNELVQIVVNPSLSMASLADVAGAIDAHEAAADPHPTYLTKVEGDDRYLKNTGKEWITKNAAYNAVAGDAIWADTTAAGFTITLPANPVANDRIDFGDKKGTFSAKNLVFARNGKTIMDLDEDMTVRTSNYVGALVYTGATWRIA